MTNKILVLGAGMISRPLVRYLLDTPDFSVAIALDGIQNPFLILYLALEIMGGMTLHAF